VRGLCRPTRTREGAKIGGGQVSHGRRPKPWRRQPAVACRSSALFAAHLVSAAVEARSEAVGGRVPWHADLPAATARDARTGVGRRPSVRREKPTSIPVRLRGGSDSNPGSTNRHHLHPTDTQPLEPVDAPPNYLVHPLLALPPPQTFRHVGSTARPSPPRTHSLPAVLSALPLPPPRFRPPSVPPGLARPGLPGRSRKGSPARSGGLPFLPKPRRDAKETPGGGAAACCAQWRNPLERNRWRETNGGKQAWRPHGPPARFRKSRIATLRASSLKPSLPGESETRDS
jgi:hypothetical protein